jgi:hypothetical protein
MSAVHNTATQHDACSAVPVFTADCRNGFDFWNSVNCVNSVKKETEA